MTWRDIRERQFKEVLERLRRLKSATIELCLIPAQSGQSAGDARGILHGDAAWPPCEGTVKPEEKSNVLLQNLERLNTPRELRVGEVFWIGMRLSAAGRLFLFNLGVSGSTNRLAPKKDADAEWVDSREWIWVGEQRRFTSDMRQGISFKETGGEGEKYPERLLAIAAIRRDVDLTAADLHADWESTYRGGWGKVQSEPSGFWAWDPTEFTWGEITLPVVRI